MMLKNSRPELRAPKRVLLGDEATVDSGSAVINDVSPYTIVAGNPARVIREIPLDER